VLQETQDREEIIQRVAALDIGKAEVVCCVRVPNEGRRGRRLQEVQAYPTMTGSLLRMSDRLRCLGVTRVVMEATSDYWKPAFYVLEAAGFETWLVNAKDVKHLPGRPKTDKCAWPGGHPGEMKCSSRPAGRGRRIQNGALRVRDKFGAGPAGPWIVATSTNPSFV
jgi:hypothetical protein